MKTQEIPFKQWPLFLDQFSRLHRGQQVTVESMSREFGVQANARDLPLLGVTAEPLSGSAARIEIMAGDSPSAQVTHVIDRPAHVRVLEFNDSVSATMQIESADGQVTLLRVGPPNEMLPPGFIVDDIILPPKQNPAKS
jgi:malate synthase